MKLKFIATFIVISSIMYSQSITTFQAEDGTLSNAKVEAEHSGFSGSGYVNFDNEVGSSLEWIVPMAESSSDTLVFTFANGGTANRYMELEINDSLAIQKVDFNPTSAWTNWNETTVVVNMKEGNNKIRLVSATSEGGPNLDKLDVSGIIGVRKYTLSVDPIGNGSVNISPNDTIFDAGSEVTMTAKGDYQWIFSYWLGVDNIDANPLTITMDRDYNISAVFQDNSDSVEIKIDTPEGFATVNALGQNGTYGGEGGDTVHITSGEQLFALLDGRRDSRFDKNNPPLILLIEGTITWTEKEMMDVKETYDLTFLGKGTTAQIVGFGFNVFRSHNIIIRNIEFRDAPDDAVNITNELSHHIWVDHCTFSDYPAIDLSGNDHDGLLDIKDGASYVTVSWNHFMNHHKSCLIGHSDNNGSTDIGRLKVTYMFNWFENTISRHPRVRFGEVHILNNYYENTKNQMLYGIASTMVAKVVVEGNYFLSLPFPTHSGYADSGPGDIVERNNIFYNSGSPETLGVAFDPTDYYSFDVVNPLLIPKQVVEYSGSGKLDSIATSVQSNRSVSLDNFVLEQNYPNPFNPSTNIRFSINNSSFVNLSIYNALGEMVKELVNEQKSIGTYNITFNAEDLSSGIYFIKLRADNGLKFRKMVLLK